MSVKKGHNSTRKHLVSVKQNTMYLKIVKKNGPCFAKAKTIENHAIPGLLHGHLDDTLHF